MAFFDFYLQVAHAQNMRIRKNEPDLIDVKFPSEVFYPKRDTLIIVVDSSKLFVDQVEAQLTQLFHTSNGYTKTKIRSCTDKTSCKESMKNNPDLIVIGDPADANCIELKDTILNINPKQKVLCVGSHHTQDKSDKQEAFGLKSLIMQDPGAFKLFMELVRMQLH